MDREGNVLGKHKGITHYTIGQRKGLNLAFGYPVFVTELRPDTNEVVLGGSEDVFTKELLAGQIHCMAVEHFQEGQRMLAKIRYADKGQMCTVKRMENDTMVIVFDEKVRAVTPGQAVVFYQEELVLGGGTILGKCE